MAPRPGRWVRASALSLCAAVYLVMPGCGSDGFSGCPQGQETCSCYGNKTCDSELTCLSNVCVRAGAGTGGDAASGGNSGTGAGGASTNRGGSGGTVDPGGGSTSAGAGGEDVSGAGSGAGGAAGSGDTTTGSGGTTAGKGGAANLGGRTQGGASSGGATAGAGGSAEGGAGPQGGASNAPTVLILLDNSSSMFEGPLDQETAWSITHSALMASPNGVLEAYGERVRFGFSSFKGNSASTVETNPACATMTTVAFDAGRDAIGNVFDALSSEWTGVEKWETPTGHALRRATELLLGDSTPGPKYILLITDGNPNTCKTLDPQCGQDRSVSAVQDAFRAGIKTYAVGVGDILAQSGTIQSGCTTTTARCGLDHLTDLANAGQGLPVLQPPAGYVYLACFFYETSTYLATYSATGGGAVPGAGATVAELDTALHDALDAIIADAR